MIGNYNTNDDFILLHKGIISNELLIYSDNNYLYIVKNDIRMFKVSFKRLVKTCNIPLKVIISIIVKNNNKIYLYNDKNNINKFFLVIKYFNNSYKMLFKYVIKLKEIDEYLKIEDSEKSKQIILKQSEKINILLKKLEYYENKYCEQLTDEEFL
jgi:hypothetical protein